MIKLSKRLEAISSLVPNNSNVIDIGCDHALLDIYLYQQKISKKVIASDINENALNGAKENIKKYNLESVIETRLGNGLDTLEEKDNINTIVISGMGANTIVGILKNNYNKLKKVDTIIIQSNTKLYFLRKEITKLNYKISDELMIEDNKIYTIIKFIKGKKRYNKKELYLGPILIKKNTDTFRMNNQLETERLNILLNMIPKHKIFERFKIKKQLKIYTK